MERIVNFSGPELLCIKGEHFRSRQFLGIKGASPGGVLITGRADEWVHVEIIGKELEEFKGGEEPGARIQEPEGRWVKQATHQERGFCVGIGNQ